MEWTTDRPGKHAHGWYWSGMVFMVEVTPELQPGDGCVARENSDIGHAKYEFTHWMGPLPRPALPGSKA